MALQTVLFYVTAALIVFSAVRVVTAQHIFRSALYLAVTLASTAVLFLLMHAEFVAVVQILVYVGAVIILLIFAVMLTAQMGDEHIKQANRMALPAILACAGLFYAFYKALSGGPWAKVVPAAASTAMAGAKNNLQAVGLSLLSDYVYPFELIALILLTALVGAVLIARKDPE